MPSTGTISGTDTQKPADLLHLALPISQKVILVIDLVESVRLMSADEAGTVARWHDFVRHAQTQAIPAHQGRLVKSLGDGLMVEFEHARDAVNAAQTLHLALSRTNAELSAERQMHLRAGINSSQIYTDLLDIYGAGVNLAARLATLAGPGETVVSASARDGLTDGLDASIEDLGECYLKHIEAPVRAYRVGIAGPRPIVTSLREYAAPLQPTIAVIPFTARSNEPEHFAIGELIADGVIAQLSRTAEVRVISRLSSTAFRGRVASMDDVQAYLGATYVLNGSYSNSGSMLLVSAELADTRSNEVVWALRLTGTINDLVDADSVLVGRIATGAHRQVVNTEVQRAVTMPLPSLDSCTLMLGAITLMHRLSKGDFAHSRTMLEHLIARHPQYVTPRAWLGKWYSLAVAQGWSDNARKDTEKSLGVIHSALDIDSRNALALTIKALIHGYVEKKFDLAHETYADALTSNPNEPLAWIGTATLHTWQGHSEAAVHAAETALALSPIDPMKYYFDSLAAVAMLSAGRYLQSVELASRSLRMNRALSSTYKTLATAQFMNGSFEDAKSTVNGLMQIEPYFSVDLYQRTSPAYQSPQGPKYAAALLGAGVPAR